MGALLFAAAAICSGSAQAQVSPPVDFDAILADLDNVLDTVLEGNWSGGLLLWQEVPGQVGPGFTGVDNDVNNINEDDQLALLAAVLNGQECANAIGTTNVTNIRNAFLAGRNYIFNKANSGGIPPGIQLTINGVTVTNGGFLVPNQTLTIQTGGTTCLNTIIGDQCFDIESLWGTYNSGTQSFEGGLLDSADPLLDDYLINLGAAILTTGDTRMIDWFQSMMAQVVVGYLPILIDNLLASLRVADIATVDAWKATQEYASSMPAPDRYTIPCVTISQIGPVTINYSGVTADITVPAGSLCTALQNFINQFSCTGATGVCQAARLAYDGNLNADATTNVTSYLLAADRAEFLSSEWVHYPDPIVISTQPASDSILVGDTGSFTFDWDKIATEPYTVQWYSGSQSNGSDLSAIGGANSATLNLPAQSSAGTTYYQGRVSDACGNTTSSNLVSLLVEPIVNITAQPPSATVNVQGNHDLTVVANITDGGLTYQWQKYNTGTAMWDDLVGETTATYSITGAEFTDSGDYRCVIDSDTYSTSATTTTATISVVVPQVVISVQPVGAGVLETDPYDLTVTTSIALSPPTYLGTLTIEWFKNGLSTGVFGDTYSIASFGLADEGEYFARITSDDFPSGPNQRQKDSAAVSLSLDSGVAFRVDQSAPRPGNNPPGETWEDAFATIQEGINAANSAGGGAVWVAGGPGPSYYVYDEVRTEPWGLPEQADGSLVMKDNVQIYGGFEGYTGPNGAGLGLQEVSLSQRSVHNVPTTISGAGTRNGGSNDAYHVVVFGRPTSRTLNARLDGFIITGGRASGAASDYHSWRGAGVYNYGSNPIIANCTFTDNVAAVSGGAIANEENVGVGAGNATIVNCVFYNNTADRLPDAGAGANSVRGGGAIFNNLSDAVIQFCTIYGNTVGTPGFIDQGVLSGGVYNWEASPVINSSILWNNTSGDVLTEGSAGDTNEAQVTYTNAQSGVLAGTGNISNDPLFATTGPEFLLGGGSPSEGAADPGLAAVTNDLRGVPRPQPSAGASDQGAFESVVASVIACQNQTFSLNASGTVTINGSQIIDGTSAVPAGIWKLLLDDGGTQVRNLPLDCADAAASPISVNLTLIDLAGGTDTCVSSVTVNDTTPPTAVCQDITVSLDGTTGEYTLTAAEIDGGSTDVCTSPVILSIPATTFTCADAGQIRVVELTVEDDAGNSDSCFANVTVEDTSGPIMNCTTPPAVQLNAAGTGSLSVAAIDGGITDACSGVDTIELSQSVFSCADLGTVNVTVTATDNLGNQNTCVVPVDVEDNILPTIALTGPSSLTVLIDTSYTEQGAVATDNCDGTQPASVGGDTVDVSTAGPYIVTYNYIDGSGNVATQVTRTVTVITDPPAVITILGDNPAIVECGVDGYSDDGATAEDEDLGDISGDIVTTGLPIDTLTPGTYVVMYSVLDDVGTETIETRDVFVQDNLAPAIIVLGDDPYGIEVGSTFTDPGVSISDACDDAISPVVGGDTVDTNTPGSYLITYDATDSEGNVAPQQTRTVVVVTELLNFVGVSPDVQAYVDDPAFTLHATFAGGANVSAYEWNEPTLGLVDSGAVSGNTVSLVVTPGTGGGQVPVGQYEYTATVTDDTGDTDSSAINVGIFARLGVAQDIVDAEITLGDDHVMTFGVTGGIAPLNYQWQYDLDSAPQAKVIWQDLSDTGNYSGTSTDTLTITGFLAENEGMYRCQVSDSGSDTLTSYEATLTASAGVPVGGALGLLGLAALSALSGAAAIRRRK